MTLMTYDSRALLSEIEQEYRNTSTAWDSIVTNDIPKIYISAAYFTKEDIEADGILTDGQIAPEDYLETGRDYKERILLPYLEKLGSCELINLPGDHLIYEQKPDECGQIMRDFMDGLEQ